MQHYIVRRGDVWRHVARGSVYRVVNIGRMQCAGTLDMQATVIYQGLEGGPIWVRPKTEFLDGRFEPVNLNKRRPRWNPQGLDILGPELLREIVEDTDYFENAMSPKMRARVVDRFKEHNSKS